LCGTRHYYQYNHKTQFQSLVFRMARCPGQLLIGHNSVPHLPYRCHWPLYSVIFQYLYQMMLGMYATGLCVVVWVTELSYLKRPLLFLVQPLLKCLVHDVFPMLSNLFLYPYAFKVWHWYHCASYNLIIYKILMYREMHTDHDRCWNLSRPYD
jgi:hypothetical protein